jgi:hypothetical protein
MEILPMSSYKDLLVWQRSMDLAEHVYDFARTLPTQERFGLCSQLRRATVSIPQISPKVTAAARGRLISTTCQ